MSRPRGNKTSKADQEARKAKALEIIKENPQATTTAVADALGVSRMTLWRYMVDIRQKFELSNAENFHEMKQAQLRVLEKIEEALIEEKIPTEVAREWRQVRSDIATLLGLNAPTKSITARVGESDVDVPYLKFKSATCDLSETQLESVYAFARSLPREHKKTVMDASWFPPPMPPQLTEGEPE